MKINRNNYESFFVDYLEGNLDEKLVNDFIEFLQQNPDLKKELSLFNSVSIESESILFNKKENLYREKYDSDKTFNETSVASIEGDISKMEEKTFKDYLQKHPEKKKDFLIFKKTKLHPENNIIFRKKSKLYHYPITRTILLWSGSVAAVLVLALTFYILTKNTSENLDPNNQVVSSENKTDTNKIVDETENKSKPLINQEETNLQSSPEEMKVEQSVIKTLQAAEKLESKPADIISANSKEQVIENEPLLERRTPYEIPAKLSRISASVIEKPDFTPIKINPDKGIFQSSENDEKLFADIIKEKTGVDNLSVGKIAKAGLKLISGVTKNNFTYETNTNGKVTEINYDSHFFAFSIPTDGEKRNE